MKHEIRVAVVDDHPLFREGVVHLLKSHKLNVVGEGATADDAVRLAKEQAPDVLILDMKLPGSGLAALERIVAEQPEASVLLLTVVDDRESVVGALRGGARGYLLKGVRGSELLEAVRRVSSGEIYIAPSLVGMIVDNLHGRQEEKVENVEFTEREEQVLSLLARGMSNKEIAYRLELSEKTVKYYLTHVLKKLNLRNRVEAALFASHRTFQDPPIVHG